METAATVTLTALQFWGALFAIMGVIGGGCRWIIGRFDKKFECIDKKFETMEQRFDKKFDAIDRKFDAIDRKFEGTHNDLSEIKGRLSVVETILAITGAPIGGFFKKTESNSAP